MTPNTVFNQADEDILHFNDRFFKSEIQIMFAELDVEISEVEIVMAIKMSNSWKMSGPDRLLNDFFSWSCYIAKILKIII